MKKYQTYIGVLLLLLMSESLYASSMGLLDVFKRKNKVEPVSSELYDEGCGECHFPYQPGWLPKASWEKLLDPVALEDHFGENAELDDEDRQGIKHFLLRHAADNSWYRLSKKIMHSLKKDEVPKRITETAFIHKKHGEVPEKYIKGNKKVKSLSNCERCHTQAEKGVFAEDTVVIPDEGRWIKLDWLY